MEVLRSNKKLLGASDVQHSTVLVDLAIDEDNNKASSSKFKCENVSYFEEPSIIDCVGKGKENELQGPNDHESLYSKRMSSKKRAANTQLPAQQKIMRAAAQSKIDKEFSKLTEQEQYEFISKAMQKLHRQPDVDHDNACFRTGENAGEILPNASLSEERDLMKLRLELGDTLNRQAELKSKEKKLRLAIKKLQRKLSSSTEYEFDPSKEKLEDILRLLFPFNHEEKDKGLQEQRQSVINCPLWLIAQQSDTTDQLCNRKRISTDRDAIFLIDSSQALISDFPSHLSTSDVVNPLVEATGIGYEHDSSIYSQILNIIDSKDAFQTTRSTAEIKVSSIDQMIQIISNSDYSARRLMDVREGMNQILNSCDMGKEMRNMVHIDSSFSNVDQYRDVVWAQIGEILLTFLELSDGNQLDMNSLSCTICLLWTLIDTLLLKMMVQFVDESKLLEEKISGSMDDDQQNCCKSNSLRQDASVIDLTCPSPTCMKSSNSSVQFNNEEIIPEEPKTDCCGCLEEIIKMNKKSVISIESSNHLLATLDTSFNFPPDKVSTYRQHITSNEKTEITPSVVKSFLLSNLDLYQDILMYVPLNLEEVHSRMQLKGYRISKESLKSILDGFSIYQTVGSAR